jgi:hypothetical protein
MENTIALEGAMERAFSVLLNGKKKCVEWAYGY